MGVSGHMTLRSSQTTNSRRSTGTVAVRKAVHWGVWSWACMEGRPDTRAIQLRDSKAEAARPNGAAFNCSDAWDRTGRGIRRREARTPTVTDPGTPQPEIHGHGAYLAIARACNSRGTGTSSYAVRECRSSSRVGPAWSFPSAGAGIGSSSGGRSDTETGSGCCRPSAAGGSLLVIGAHLVVGGRGLARSGSRTRVST